MLNKFSKNSFRHPDLTYFLAEQNYKKMKKNIWSYKNFHERKLTLKYLWSKAVKVYNLENKYSYKDLKL